MSLDTFLFKAFKFFDLNNNGCLAKNDFFRAIAKCGVAVDSEVIILRCRLWIRFIGTMQKIMILYIFLNLWKISHINKIQ